MFDDDNDLFIMFKGKAGIVVFFITRYRTSRTIYEYFIYLVTL